MVVRELNRQGVDAFDGFAGAQDADVVPESEKLPDGLDIWVMDDDRAPLRVGGRDGRQAGSQDAVSQIQARGAQQRMDLDERGRLEVAVRPRRCEGPGSPAGPPRPPVAGGLRCGGC